MWLAVISDDRRAVVEVTEIETAAALLLDVEVTSLSADVSTGGLAGGIGPLDVRGYFSASRR
jgi:hypothetical protein